MPKPVAGSIFYNTTTDRPRVALRVGERDLLTTDDSGGGGTVTEVDSPDGSIIVTNPTGPVISVEANFGTTAGTVAEGNDSRFNSLLQGSELWEHPASAHASDIEFESTTLPAALVWANATMTPITPSNAALDPLTRPVTDPRYQVHTQRRRSWLQWQTPADTVRRYIHFPYAAATNACAWTRIGFSTYAAAVGTRSDALDDEVGMRFILFTETGGAPDPANYVFIELHYQAIAGTPNQLIARPGVRVAGLDTLVPSGASAFAQHNGHYNGAHAYLGIRKISTDYSFYFSSNGESAVHLHTTDNIGASGAGGSFTTFSSGGSILHAGVSYQQNGNRIHSVFNCDFFRFQNDGNALPW